MFILCNADDGWYGVPPLGTLATNDCTCVSQFCKRQRRRKVLIFPFRVRTLVLRGFDVTWVPLHNLVSRPSYLVA